MLTVTHSFTSPLADDSVATSVGEVLPSHWNAQHVIVDNGITSGPVVIGVDPNVPIAAGVNSHFQVQLNDGLFCGSFLQYGNDGNDPSLTFAKTRGTTPSSQVIVQGGDWLGEIDWYGSNGTNFLPSGVISCSVEGTPGAHVPGALHFYTASSSSNAFANERMRIDSNGNKTLNCSNAGTAPGQSGFGTGANGLTLLDDNTMDWFSLSMEGYSSTISGVGGLASTFSRSSTIGGQAIVQNGDHLLTYTAWGSDGVRFIQSAGIAAFVDSTPSVDSMPGRLIFYTAPTSGGPFGNVERLRIDNAGNVIVNTGAIATNATDGFLYIPTCAGTPTGTPTAYTGRVPMVYDTSAHKLWIYDTAWKGVVLT